MNKNLKLLLSLFLFSMIIGCGNEEKSPPSNYEIVDEEIYETNNKAQLIEYIVYKDTIYTQEVLEKILLDVYDKNKNKDVFDNFDSPTVFGVNIYTSRENAKNDKGGWIGTLTKLPNDSKPRLSYNDLKIKSLQGLNDNKKSEDEIAYENLTKYLQERNIELCSFYQQLGDMELNCIHEADAKFPDYDYPEHGNYADKRMKEEREKLITKHNLVDSIFVRISVFGMAYCK